MYLIKRVLFRGANGSVSPDIFLSSARTALDVLCRGEVLCQLETRDVGSEGSLLGLGYLLLRRVISTRVPLSYLETVAVLALLTTPKGVPHLTWAACQLMGGGLLLGAAFFATDPTTSPATPRG